MNRAAALPSYTTRTTAFASATGITDTTILGALNTFDLGLISNGIDTKMKAVYPFVGNTATTQKFNFMDARDLDVAFRLQFNGGWTHSITGALPNGTNAYANTYVTPSSNLNADNLSVSYYSRTNISIISNQILFDVFQGAGQCMQLYFTPTKIFFDNYNTISGISVNETRSFGMYIGNRQSSIINKVLRNGSILGTSTISNAPTNRPTVPLFLAAANTGSGAVVFSKLECAFSSIGNGLTDTEASTFYNLVQTMQTTLSRQV
jgi:hypothetical protein